MAREQERRGGGREGGHAVALGGEEERGGAWIIAGNIRADCACSGKEGELTDHFLCDRGERKGDPVVLFPEDDGGAIRDICGVVDGRRDLAGLIGAEQVDEGSIERTGGADVNGGGIEVELGSIVGDVGAGDGELARDGSCVGNDGRV